MKTLKRSLFLALLFALVPVFCPTSNASDLPERYVKGELPDDLRELVLQGRVFEHRYSKSYKCGSYASDLVEHLKRSIRKGARREPRLRRFRPFLVLLYAPGQKRTYRGNVDIEGVLVRSPTVYGYHDGHAMVGVEDGEDGETYFIEPQSEDPRSINLDFNGDGVVSSYKGVKKFLFSLLPPSEDSAGLAEYADEANAVDLGWKIR